MRVGCVGKGAGVESVLSLEQDFETGKNRLAGPIIPFVVLPLVDTDLADR